MDLLALSWLASVAMAALLGYQYGHNAARYKAGLEALQKLSTPTDRSQSDEASAKSQVLDPDDPVFQAEQAEREREERIRSMSRGDLS